MGPRAQQLAGVIGQKQTAVIAAVVDEITAQPAANPVGLQLMPVVDYPAELIYTEEVSGFGGLVAERSLGAPGQSGASGSSQTTEYQPGYYQESKTYTERDLLFLRRLGSMGERGLTGLTSGELDFMSRGAQELKTKVSNRMNKLAWDALFTGKYVYQGQTKFDFNIPVGNTVQAATDWTVQGSATPFTDLFNIVTTNPTFFKYIIDGLIMNPKTAAAMLTSQEARTLITNNSAAAGDVNKIAQILYPGLPTIEIVKEAWQDQSVVGGNIVLGPAQFFVPDFKILAKVNMGGTLFAKYGELQMVYNLNDPAATLEKPSTGVYTFVDEEGLKRRKSPFAEVVTGFNGGPNLMRRKDVLIIKVKAGI